MEKAERGSRLNMILYYTHEERIHVASTFQPTAIQFIHPPLVCTQHVSYVAGANLGGVVGSDKVEWGLLCVPPCHDSIGPVLDEEGGSKGVPPQDGQVQEAVAL